MCVCGYYSISLYLYLLYHLVILFLSDSFLEVGLPHQRADTLKFLLAAAASCPKPWSNSYFCLKGGSLVIPHQMLSVFLFVCQSDGQRQVTCFNLHFPTTLSTSSYQPLKPCQSVGPKKGHLALWTFPWPRWWNSRLLLRSELPLRILLETAPCVLESCHQG